MIENFRVITEGSDVAYVETDINRYGSKENISYYYTANQSQDEIYRVMGNPRAGLAWTYENREIVLLDDTFERVTGFPSLDLKYVVTSYTESQKYPKPNNIIIYKDDGTVHLENVVFPKAVNKDFRWENIGIDFAQFNWRFDEEDNEWKNCMWLIYSQSYLERREFNPETGEFGKLLPGGTRP